MNYKQIIGEENLVNTNEVSGNLDLKGKEREEVLNNIPLVDNTTVVTSDIPDNKFDKTKGEPDNLSDLSEKIQHNSNIPKNPKFNVHKKQKSLAGSGNYGYMESHGGMEPTYVEVSGGMSEKRMPTGKFTPRVGMDDIIEKIYMESQNMGTFKLDMSNLIADKANCKLQIERNGQPLIVELMFPNANGKLSIRLDGGSYDDVFEVSLDSEEYYNLSEYIKLKADELIEAMDKGAGSSSMDDLKPFSELGEYVGSGYNDGDMAFMGTGSSSEDKVRGNIFNSFKGNFMDSISLDGTPVFEADEDEETTDAPDDFSSADEADVFDDASTDEDIGVGFEDTGDETASDFGDDAMSDMFGGGGTDFDSTFGGGSDVGEPEMSSGEEGVEETITFNDKDDWENSALRTMNDLIADYEAKQMQDGDGVMLTKDEILNGTPGIEGMTNKQIIDKFLKIYRELDGLEIPLDTMLDIEEKLKMNDGQFDSYIKGVLPELMGTSEMADISALNNDMFTEYNPSQEEEPVIDETEEIIGDTIDTNSLIDEETESDENIESAEDMSVSDFDKAFGLDAGLEFNDIEPDVEE